MNSWDQHVKLKTNSPYKDLKWRVAGPEFMSGRIETIAVSSRQSFYHLCWGGFRQFVEINQSWYDLGIHF